MEKVPMKTQTICKLCNNSLLQYRQYNNFLTSIEICILLDEN